MFLFLHDDTHINYISIPHSSIMMAITVDNPIMIAKTRINLLTALILQLVFSAAAGVDWPCTDIAADGTDWISPLADIFYPGHSTLLLYDDYAGRNHEIAALRRWCLSLDCLSHCLLQYLFFV